jgi:hypothetical protein
MYLQNGLGKTEIEIASTANQGTGCNSMWVTVDAIDHVHCLKEKDVEKTP